MTESDWRTVLQDFDIGTIFRIRTGEGTASAKIRVLSGRGEFIVRRIPPGEMVDVHLRYDHALRNHLAKEGFPAPQIVPSHFGEPFVKRQLECSEGIFEMSHLLPGCPVMEPDAEQLFETGRTLAWFHELGESFEHAGKDTFVREDDPSMLEPLYRRLQPLAKKRKQNEPWQRLGEELGRVAAALTGVGTKTAGLTVIHGDFHPGNVLFDGQTVSGVLDYDYCSGFTPLRDLGDGLMFFSAGHTQTFDTNDIWSLTQEWRPDATRAAALLNGYSSRRTLPVTWELLNELMVSRWLQCRLRGARKVADSDKIDFVLKGLWGPLDFLRYKFPVWFRAVRRL